MSRQELAGMRARWRRLTPRQRALLISHRPEPFESEWALEHSVMTALENVYGPRQWSATVAVLAEGDRERPLKEPKEPEFAMTLDEIGQHFGLSVERIRGIINSACEKLRRNPETGPILESLLDSSPWKAVRR